MSSSCKTSLPQSPNMAELFRPEAIEHHRQRLFGEIVMAVPLTHWAVTAVIALAFVLLLSFLSVATYARKETVGGWVRPDRGIVHVQVADAGTVDSVSVKEGQDVEPGAALVSLRLDADVASGESMGGRLARDLQGERQQLLSQIEVARSQAEGRRARLQAELAGLVREIAQYQSQLAVVDRRVVLAQRQLDERQALVKQGFITKLDADKVEDGLLASRQAREELAQDQLVKERQANAIRHQLAEIPHEQAMAESLLEERVAALGQRTTEAARRSHVVLTSPVAGSVADVRIEPGETAKANAVLVDILPKGAQLQVELFVPTRATGLLSPGMEVQLRFDAFPYQKFGVTKGRILRVSRSTMDAKDLPRAVAPDEPVYRTIVALDHSNVVMAGKSYPLQAGMTLKADLILERRRLIEFVFEALMGVAQRG